jgi:NAD(P)-dependent dehydrogenase (short-subunit alcohol dehydrogenase family)
MANWLITGAGAGLGRAIAEAALARGDTVAGTVRRADAAAELRALAPGRSFAFEADMTDAASVRRAVEDAEAALGGLDILVNNAGYGLVGAVEEVTLEEVRAQFEVNVFAPIAAIQAVLPHFRRRRAGHIINITSISGLAAWAGTGIYCGSKHAMEGVGQTLAQEVAPLGIKVTNVEPGSVDTGFASGHSLTITKTKIADYDETAHNSERILTDKSHPKSGDPAKVAAAILRIAGADDAPLQLMLGADAVHYATRTMAAFWEEYGRWAPVSLSIAYDD